MELLQSSQSFYLLRLDSGMELHEEVERFCDAQGIGAAWVNALGSSQEVELAFYNPEKKEYETKVFSERLEIVTVAGNVSLKPQESGVAQEGRDPDLLHLKGDFSNTKKPFLHIHGTFSRPSMEVVGGHIVRCLISATCEVGLWKSEGRIERRFDERTGLGLLCPMG